MDEGEEEVEKKKCEGGGESDAFVSSFRVRIYSSILTIICLTSRITSTTIKDSRVLLCFLPCLFLLSIPYLSFSFATSLP